MSTRLAGFGSRARPCAHCSRPSFTFGTTLLRKHDIVHHARPTRWFSAQDWTPEPESKRVKIGKQVKEQWRKTVDARWGSSARIDQSTDFCTDDYRHMSPALSPGLIPAKDLELLQGFEKVPARVGECIRFGCTAPEQLRLLAVITRRWAREWMEIMSGLNHTVPAVDWSPPQKWLRAHSPPPRLGRRYDDAVNQPEHKAMLDNVDGESRLPLTKQQIAQRALPLIKYHLKIKPGAGYAQYKGERAKSSVKSDKEVSAGSLEALLLYSDRWVRKWLPMSVGAMSRTSPSKARVLHVVPVSEMFGVMGSRVSWSFDILIF